MFISWYFWHVDENFLPGFKKKKKISETELQILTIGNNFDYTKMVKSKGYMQEVSVTAMFILCNAQIHSFPM